MGCCNYKVAVIVIAVLTIMSAVSNICKTSYHLKGDDHEYGRRHHHKHHPHHHHRHHHHRHHHHHGNSTEMPEVDKDFIEERVDKDDEIKKPEVERFEKHDDKGKNEGDKVKSKHNLRAAKIGSIISSILSIVTAALMFAVVSDSHEKNKQRKKFLLPYIIWHIVVICICIAGAIYTAIAYRSTFEKEAVVIILVWAAAITVASIFLYFVTKYYNLLGDTDEKPANADGFTYSKMAGIEA